jgi:hypothetical protein
MTYAIYLSNKKNKNMELRTQTNGTRFVKETYDALAQKFPFFSAVYIPIGETDLKRLSIVAKDANGVYVEYDYKEPFEYTGDNNFPCGSGLGLSLIHI